MKTRTNRVAPAGDCCPRCKITGQSRFLTERYSTGNYRCSNCRAAVKWYRVAEHMVAALTAEGYQVRRAGSHWRVWAVQPPCQPEKSEYPSCPGERCVCSGQQEVGNEQFMALSASRKRYRCVTCGATLYWLRIRAGQVSSDLEVLSEIRKEGVVQFCWVLAASSR